jgi:hypothetical protein
MIPELDLRSSPPHRLQSQGQARSALAQHTREREREAAHLLRSFCLVVLLVLADSDRSTTAAMAQGRCSAVLAVALLVVSCAAAVQGTNYTVGDAEGWSKPNGNTIPDGYLATWASGKTFNAGDNLCKCLALVRVSSVGWI